MPRKKIAGGALFGLVALFAVCSIAEARPEAKPDWITRGKAFPSRQTFYGVGSSPQINKNPILAEMVATQHARTQLLALVESYANALLADYLETLSQEDAMEKRELEALETQFKIYARSAATTYAVEDESWTDQTTWVVYSLSKLRLSRFSRELLKGQSLTPKLREFVKTNARKSFDRFQLQTAK